MKNNYSDNTNIFADMAEPSVNITKTVCDKKMTADLSGEFTLPDYLPEMRRLVRVSVIPTAPSKFVSASSAQFGGGVDYHVCYIGADGRLCGTVFSGEYNFNASFDPDVEYDVDEGITAVADIVAETVVGRVIGARKLGLRSRLVANILALGCSKNRAPEWAREPVHANTMRLMKDREYHKRVVGSNDEIVVRDTLDMSADGSRYVSADCGAFLEEVRSGDGYVDCRGTVKVRYLLCKEGENTPYVLEKRYQISETVEIDGMKEGARCTAFCVCTGIDATNLTGGGNVECNLRLRIVAQGFVPETLSYVADAYSTAYDTECHRKSILLPDGGCCGLRNMTFDGVMPLEKLSFSGTKENVSVISVIANAALSEAVTDSAEGEAAAVSGNVTFNILYSAPTDDGSEELMTAEAELPFKIEGFEGVGKGKMSVCSASAFDPRARIGVGEIELGCEIAVSCATAASESVECVSDVTVKGELSSKRSGISVCFPGGDESVWSVAKKYRVSADRVRAENGISDEIDADNVRSLENVKYLIV